MKKARLLGLACDRDRIFAELMRLGCVEIRDRAALADGPEYAALAERAVTDTDDIKSATRDLKQALDTLIRYVHPKRNMFAQRPVLSEKELLNAQALQNARDAAAEILGHRREIAALNSEEGRLQNRSAALRPWIELSAPLNVSSTAHCVISLGVCPASAKIDELAALMEEQVPLSVLFRAGSDREQHYLMVICHVSAETEMNALLKSYGFSRMQFKDVGATAAEAVAACEMRMGEIEIKRGEIEKAICSHAGELPMLERAIDALGLYMSRAEAAGNALSTQSCFYLTAWVDETRLQSVERVFSRYDCAYDFSSPEPESDAPPIKLKNSKFIEPFNMVTDMYSPPDYFNVDPNPLFSLFFALFFGIMYADLGYGLVLTAIGLFVTLKLKARGMFGQMCRLLIIVGASSAVMGLVFGGFFSDAVNVIGSTFFGRDSWGIPPMWFDPLTDPLTLLIACLAIGTVQLIFGMAVQGWLLIRDGKPWDAVMDIGSWWLLFAGIGVLALGGAPWVMYAGFAAIVLTQGRRSKNIFGKLFGGVGKLYDITAYLSDVLSYCRLMALCMAGAVIGSVFNMLAGMLGGANIIIGPILFAVVFLVGHTFNMAINIIGTYVHAARLQYLEFFGKFYEGGGKPFKPLTIKTNFVDIIKEEN
ncbi:MAG: V-type ATP synthase subunit I [Oscillospiraceae bacterium]|nr:V-type ATP synthase subunit I [Oscillospiraceae bacterium]